MNDLKVRKIEKTGRIKSKIESLKRKLLDIGLLLGAILEIKKIAPLGETIDVLFLDYNLSLRNKETENIITDKK